MSKCKSRAVQTKWTVTVYVINNGLSTIQLNVRGYSEKYLIIDNIYSRPLLCPWRLQMCPGLYFENKMSIPSKLRQSTIMPQTSENKPNLFITAESPEKWQYKKKSFLRWRRSKTITLFIFAHAWFNLFHPADWPLQLLPGSRTILLQSWDKCFQVSTNHFFTWNQRI